MLGTHGRSNAHVLVLDRDRLVAEAVAAALGGGALGLAPAGDGEWLAEWRDDATVVVLDEGLPRSVLDVVFGQLRHVEVVLLLDAAEPSRTARAAWGTGVTVVSRRDGLGVLRRHVRALRHGLEPTVRLGTDRRDLGGLLTAREYEVGGLMAAGQSNEQIAQALAVSVHTVRTHVQRILLKLAAPNRFAAADLLRDPAPERRPDRVASEDGRLVEGRAG